MRSCPFISYDEYSNANICSTDVKTTHRLSKWFTLIIIIVRYYDNETYYILMYIPRPSMLMCLFMARRNTNKYRHKQNNKHTTHRFIYATA